MDKHDLNEIKLAHNALTEIRKQPLADRKDAREKFREACATDPAIVGERISWLLEGDYGYGPMLLAKRIADNPRMNRAAALAQLIAAFEWMCPEDFARDARKRLTKKQQALLDRVVQSEIKAYAANSEAAADVAARAKERA